MISSLLREPIFALRRSKTADRWVSKWPPAEENGPPAALRDGFLTAQAPKMAAPMEDLRWTVSFQPIGTQ